MGRILVHGHRGARARMAENSLAGFAYAIEAGADALELDIAVTRDDVLVVSHDPVLMPCDVAIRDVAFTGQLPTVRQVMELAAPHQVELNLELKSFPEQAHFTPEPLEFARLLVELLRETGMERRCMVQCFDFRVVQAMRELAPDIRRGALVEDDPRDFVSIAQESGEAHYVGAHYSLVTQDKVRQAHEAGIQVLPWTVNAPEDWARMAAAEVDAIITDDPAALLAWLRCG